MLSRRVILSLAQAHLLSPTLREKIDGTLVRKYRKGEVEIYRLLEYASASGRPTPQFEPLFLDSFGAVNAYLTRYPQRARPMLELLPAFLATKPNATRDRWGKNLMHIFNMHL